MLFDLDDTLMAHTRSVDLAIERAQAVAGQLAASGIAGGDAAGFAAFSAADARFVQERWRHLEELHYARYLSGELDYLGQRVWRARDLLLPYGVELDDEAALRWFAEYLHGYRDNWTLFDDVLPTLDELEAVVPGVRFGIITNGELTFQTDKLHRIDLRDRLDLTPVRADGSVDEPDRRGRLVASGELGVTKPDLAIFAAAAGAFGVRVASCLYVGDRLATDAVGAQNAGMRGVWLARPDRNETAAAADARDARVARTLVASPGELSADRDELPPGVTRIASLAELPALLPQLPAPLPPRDNAASPHAAPSTPPPGQPLGVRAL